MKNLLFVIIGCFIGIALTRLIQLEIDTSMQYAIEKAYYEGQKDALNGVILIEL